MLATVSCCSLFSSNSCVCYGSGEKCIGRLLRSFGVSAQCVSEVVVAPVLESKTSRTGDRGATVNASGNVLTFLEPQLPMYICLAKSIVPASRRVPLQPPSSQSQFPPNKWRLITDVFHVACPVFHVHPQCLHVQLIADLTGISQVTINPHCPANDSERTMQKLLACSNAKEKIKMKRMLSGKRGNEARAD